MLPDKKPGATGLVLDAELPEALVTIVLADLQPGKEAHHAVHSKWGRDLPVPDVGASWDHLSKAGVPAASKKKEKNRRNWNWTLVVRQLSFYALRLGSATKGEGLCTYKVLSER